MRVLYISNNSSLGGAPRALLNLCREMVAEGVEVGVVVPTEDGPLVPELKALGATVFSRKTYALSVRPGLMRPSKYCARMSYLKSGIEDVRAYVGSVIDEFRPDIVHTNVGPLDLALSECQKRGLPHVWHLREYQTLDFGMKPYPSEADFRKRIHENGNWNIAITEDIARHWDLRPEDKVIYDGVFTEEQLAAKPELDGTTAEPGQEDAATTSGQGSAANGRAAGEYFMYAARIEKAKGLMMLLRAYGKYQAAGGRVPLMVCGRPCGLYAVLCKAYAALLLKGAVSFEGVVSDVNERMGKALAVVVPSRYEAFGFTTAEAMKSGALLIGRNTAGTKEQLDRAAALAGAEAGLRFSTSGELAACLAKAERGGLDAMRQHAAEAAAAYGTKRYGAEVMDLYQTILK